MRAHWWEEEDSVQLYPGPTQLSTAVKRPKRFSFYLVGFI